MDCRNWDEDAYKDSIFKEREALSKTIFRTAFCPSPDPRPNPDLIVTASSDGFIATYSIASSLALGYGNLRTQSFLVAVPNRFIKGHDGPVYDVKFYGGGEDSLLLSCGDDGHIRGWRWREMTNLEEPLHDHCLKPVLNFVNPQHKGPWGSLSPVPENNAIAVNVEKGSIFAAAGDSCAYCWDVETSKIKMVFRGHSDYLHCVVARNSHNQIITGSEDGIARIWDCRSGKCVQVIEPGKEQTFNKPFSCVSCIALDSSESWLACGSGQTLSVWNIPPCECISRVSSCANIQDVLFDEHQILAVGAEPLLTRFNMNGAILSQIQCAPQSGFSISLHPSGAVAVAGYGALVDVISQFGSHLSTFWCRGRHHVDVDC